MFRVTWCLALLCPLLVQDASSQDSARTDTTPFRRGQWAAQFGGGFSFATLGLLRFTSTRSAWLLDARLSGGHSNNKATLVTPAGDTTITAFSSDAAVSARIGRRLYRPRDGRVASFLSVGVLGGFSHSADGQGANAAESNGWNAGAFGENGGAYFITDRLTIGATADLSFVYSRATSESAGGGSGAKTVRWSYGASTPNLRFTATLYF